MGRSVDFRDHDVAQVIEVGGAPDIADQIFAGMQLGEPTACVDAKLRKRLFDLFVGEAERTQRRRVRSDAVLPDFAANGNDLRDAGNTQEARPDGKVGHLAQLHGRGFCRW